MTTVLDKFEQIVADAEIAVVVLGNEQTQEFELLDLATHKQQCVPFGLRFWGVLGLVDRQPRVALAASDISGATLAALTLAFAHYVLTRRVATGEKQSS